MLLFSAALAATPSQASALGPNVHVFTPDDDMKKVAETVEKVFKRQHHRQFGPERQAFLFLPGDYTKAGTLNVGYYTQVLGLGRSPRDVKLSNVKTNTSINEKYFSIN